MDIWSPDSAWLLSSTTTVKAPTSQAVLKKPQNKIKQNNINNPKHFKEGAQGIPLPLPTLTHIKKLHFLGINTESVSDY